MYPVNRDTLVKNPGSVSVSGGCFFYHVKGESHKILCVCIFITSFAVVRLKGQFIFFLAIRLGLAVPACTEVNPVQCLALADQCPKGGGHHLWLVTIKAPAIYSHGHFEC